MSTFAIIALIILGAFVCIFGLCEWLARRLHRSAREARETTPTRKCSIGPTTGKSIG
jgi:hypothetical protein